MTTIYEVTVEGQYRAEVDGRQFIKNYEYKFKANDAMKKAGLCAVFKKALKTQGSGQESIILKGMKKKYPDYKRYRTHVVTSVVNVNKNAPVRELQLMNRTQIIGFIDGRGLPIDPDLYPKVVDLRQALRDYRENPEGYPALEERRRRLYGSAIKIAMGLEQLNSEDENTPVEPAPVLPIANEDEIGIPEFDQQDELDRVIDGI